MSISYENNFVNLEIHEKNPWKLEPQILAHPVSSRRNYILSVSDTGLPLILVQATVLRMKSFQLWRKTKMLLDELTIIII